MSAVDTIARPDFLRKAWDALRKENRQSKDILEESLSSFESNLDTHLKNISSQLARRAYRFAPVKAVFIPKPDGSKRALKVFAIRDRVVAKAVQLVLKGKVPDPACSFGSIEGRSVKGAISRISALYNSGHTWVLEADLSKFFDNIDRSILFRQYLRHYRCRSLLGLIEDSSTPFVGNLDRISAQDREVLPPTHVGIPQGSALSPMLANLYLREFDLEMEKNGFKLIRYVDDFIVMCKSKAEAESAYECCVDILEGRLRLKLHPLSPPSAEKAKTRIFKYVQGFVFLGVRFEGARIYPARKSVAAVKETIGEICRQRGGRKTLALVLNTLDQTVCGWCQAYAFCHSRDEYQLLDKHLQAEVNGLFRALQLLDGGRTLSLGQLRRLGVRTFSSMRDKLAAHRR